MPDAFGQFSHLCVNLYPEGMVLEIAESFPFYFDDPFFIWPVSNSLSSCLLRNRFVQFIILLSSRLNAKNPFRPDRCFDLIQTGFLIAVYAIPLRPPLAAANRTEYLFLSFLLTILCRTCPARTDTAYILTVRNGIFTGPTASPKKFTAFLSWKALFGVLANQPGFLADFFFLQTSVSW